jgi:glycosyltransferase involved in cell wall biosynthesis
MTRLKYRLRSYKPYIVASEIKGVLKKHLKPADNHTEVISLKPERTSRGNVLFSYVTHAFSGQPVLYSHTSYWESRQMAETFVDLGYSVDVISAADASGFLPQKKYAFFIGHRHNFERIAQRLDQDCVKVLHCEVAHWLFHNSANSSRLLALQRRKGITLPQPRLLEPNLAIERADCATILGNEFTISTYRYANKPIYRVPISAPMLYPWPEKKDFEACRRHFLWFGSNGFVHKGLDLALDAFAAMPEYHLTVCGPIKDEMERYFEKTFYKELYQTPNIRTVGWIDDASPEFLRIANSCIGVINPSCSEGGGGSVITCMHAGLIPIVSYESSVDIGTFGFLLPDCSIESIQNFIRMVGSLPSQQLAERARQAWEFARAHHTREKFAEEYRKVVGTIMDTYGHKTDSQADLTYDTADPRPPQRKS